jgi:hypothetical protein
MIPSMKEFIIIPAMILVMVSCGSRPETSVIRSFLKADTCLYDDSHTYFIYIPAHSSGCETMPLVVIIDPHGSGSYAVSHFIEAAEKYKFILGASNLVRNNYADYRQAIEVLINDIRDKYPAGADIYLAGFSGGARMVLSYAQDHEISGVLACGALGAPDQIKSIKAYVYALAGMADFNFPEFAHFILNEPDKPANLKLQLAGELHQWPSSEDLSQALGWLYLNNRRSDAKCISATEIMKSFSAKGKDMTDSLLHSRQYIQMRLVCQNMLEIQNLPDRQYFKDSLESVMNSRALNIEMTQLRKSLQFEEKVREAYYNALATKETEWWSREIKELNSGIADNQDQNMKFAFKRIKAFLGIICYSVANNILRTDDLHHAERILEIYRMIEPLNPDMFYFFALYSLKTGKEDLVPGYLRDALEYGFSDTTQIRKEFPAALLENILPDN